MSRRRRSQLGRYRRGGAHRWRPATYPSTGVPDPSFRTPDWTHHAVWYEVMLDRFRNGCPANDPPFVHPWGADWFALQPYEGDSDFYEAAYRRHYGGDLDGLEEKLPYLQDLGVNALFLHPLFIADSYHKYDARDYVHIDPHFGAPDDDYEAVARVEDPLDASTWRWTKSDRRFLAFLQRAKSMGFRVIIDGVFNHVGARHRAFLDVRRRGRRSRYADWFSVASWRPFDYQGWADHGGMPQFRKHVDGVFSPTLKQHIFDVTRRWMAPDGDAAAGVDGWRLDVPNELPAPFWRVWREHVKALNPDAYIVGEIWTRADEWLDGRCFDAVMNYSFAEAVTSWIAGGSAKLSVSELDEQLQELRAAYPPQASLAMQNLLDSHDTDRLASMMQNPGRAYNKENRVQDGVEYDNRRPTHDAYARARLAVLAQMTYVGAPMIYYGDEIGMWGANDPTCRKPMAWEELVSRADAPGAHIASEQHAFYRAAVALRRRLAPLRVGAFRTLLTDDQRDVWAFLRSCKGEHVIVALNASQRKRRVHLPLPADTPTDWRGVFNVGGRVQAYDGQLRVTLPAVGGAAWRGTRGD